MKKEFKTTGQWDEYNDDVFVPNKETKITVCRTHKYTDTEGSDGETRTTETDQLKYTPNETKEFKTLRQWGAHGGDVFLTKRGIKLTVDRTDKYTATGCSEYSDGFDLGEDTWSLDGTYWSLVSRGTHHTTRDHRIAYVAAIAAGADYGKAKQIADTIEGLGL